MSSAREWLPIPGYEGRYEVSNDGLVRSYVRFGRQSDKRREQPVILKSDTARGGYQKVRLQGRAVYGVHQLVMLAFVGPCPAGMEVDHLDCDPSNNQLSNLQYLTPEENRAARAARRRFFKCGHPVIDNQYFDGNRRTCHQCKQKSWRLASAKRRARSR